VLAIDAKRPPSRGNPRREKEPVPDPPAIGDGSGDTFAEDGLVLLRVTPGSAAGSANGAGIGGMDLVDDAVGEGEMDT